MKDVHELEIYACIDGYPNYLVTSHGRIMSLKDNKGKRKFKERKLYTDKLGYKKIRFYNKGFNVHRLVAKAFIPNHYNKPCINHIDCNPSNNYYLNLEWVTYKENNNHANHNELISKSRKGKYEGKNNPNYGKESVTRKSVIGINQTTGDIKLYDYLSDCEKDGFTTSNVVACCRKYNNYKSHKGYKWYYLDDYEKDHQ